MRLFFSNTFSIFKEFGFLDCLLFFWHKNIIFRDVLKVVTPVKQEYQYEYISDSYEKYLELDKWLNENLKRAFRLSLHKKEKTLILDLGCGPGYFLYICKHFGHDVYGLDLNNNSMYNTLISKFNIPRFISEIKAFESLSLNTQLKFNLVTAFMITFNDHKTLNEWDLEQWDFFLEDIKNNYLLDDGKIFININASNDQEPIKEELASHLEKKSLCKIDDLSYFFKKE